MKLRLELMKINKEQKVKNLSVILLGIGVLLSMLQADETSGVQKVINTNRDILVTDALNRKTNEIMKKLTDEYGRNKKFEPQDKDLMLQKAQKECTASFDTKAVKEACVDSTALRIFKFFEVDSILYKRELNINAYNQGNELICKFFTLNGKEVQVVINEANSKLYNNASFIKDDILTNIENCELKNNSKK